MYRKMNQRAQNSLGLFQRQHILALEDDSFHIFLPQMLALSRKDSQTSDGLRFPIQKIETSLEYSFDI